jgi:hypothetical protein
MTSCQTPISLKRGEDEEKRFLLNIISFKKGERM